LINKLSEWDYVLRPLCKMVSESLESQIFFNICGIEKRKKLFKKRGSTMNFKAVIFDKDGVIIDTQPLHYKVFNNFCEENFWDISIEEYESFNGTTSIEMFTRIKNNHKIENTVDDLVNMFQKKYIDLIASLKDVKPIFGVDILIKTLHSNGIKLAIASSATRKKIELVLEMFKLEHYFDVIVSGYEVDRSKPAPDIFLRAAELLGMRIEDCIVIEDSANGITAAKSANMRCIGYQNPLGNQDLSNANIIITNFLELINGEFEVGRLKN
jgi:HAD superfamily hydrolase (TIGR01509 family)